MPLVLAHGSVALQASAQATLAELILAGASPQQLHERAPQLQALLSAAGAAFEATENHVRAAEAWYMLAQVRVTQGWL